MGSLSNGLKKFLQNKNTVTVVGVVLAILVLYFAYTMRIKSAINPVLVPYAVKQIPSGTQITESMVSTREVPPAMLKGDVILNVGEIVDKYSSADTVIPEGSLFYKRAVVEKEQLPANIILDYPKGYVLYNLTVDTKSTYGNSVYPGNYIDIYLSAMRKVEEGAVLSSSESNRVMYGKFISNVKVLAVKDAQGRPVFQNLDEARTPAMIQFALPSEINILLNKATRMRTFQTSLSIVPTNESLKDEPDDIATSEEIKEWINQNTIFNPEE